MEVKRNDEQNQPPKRVKTQEPYDSEEGEDRISLLSDCLIINEILSRLDNTKEAIRTGTLSKRWQHLWPSVPILIFSNNHHPLSDFFLFLDQTLTRCRHSQLKKIIKFKLVTGYENPYESQVNNWIHFAIINCKLQQLYLHLWNMNGEPQFVLKDDYFFNNSHFTHLYLVDCIFNPIGPITWNNLVNLSIANAKLDKDLIANIQSGSPLLDTLRLEDCYGYDQRLDITSKSVKNLEFCGYSAQEDKLDDLEDIIEINAPYLSSLSILGSLLLWKLQLLDVSSLVKANLNYTHSGLIFKEEEEEMLKKIVLKLGHVKELRIGDSCFKVLRRLEAKGFLFTSNLKPPDPIPPFYSDSSDSDASDDSIDSDLLELLHSGLYDNGSSDNDSSDSDASDID